MRGSVYDRLRYMTFTSFVFYVRVGPFLMAPVRLGSRQVSACGSVSSSVATRMTTFTRQIAPMLGRSMALVAYSRGRPSKVLDMHVIVPGKK